MGTGEVDVNWAKEHHSLWADEAQSSAPAGPPPRGVPAE
jgi:formate dehydrogenase subunit gamma